MTQSVAKSRRSAVAAGVIAAMSLGCAHGRGPTGTVLWKDVTFTRYSPLSRSEEILRRVLPPLAFRRGQQALAARGEALRDQPVDLAAERFSLYVPAGSPPARGYGVVVFVSPSQQAMDPSRWRSALDRHGLIFVSAAESGNDANVLERRLPLALLACENVRARYAIDPERVYVGGFSGGSRVAEVTALAYPDLFRGVLLNAGSDPIGDGGLPLPAAGLFAQFQRTRLVYATGGRDEARLERDEISRASMRKWCVLDLEVEFPQGLGHEPLDAISFDRALDALDQRSEGHADRQDELSRCNGDVQGGLHAKLARVRAALEHGDTKEARAQLEALDAQYGGLAAHETLALDAILAATR